MLFKKIKELIDPKIGKTVIHFTTHGCMATIHEFDYIGKIIGIESHKDFSGGKFLYVVKVLKDRHGGEKRNNNLEREYEQVPSWYLKNIGGDFYIVYD